ncbi:hypothetical protein HBA55_20070 [Pseudomaricurvus alkylphenolicus]|uniref:Lar family restriction alleviation protein n=1 Tax=Pseudomaricurvus alkylphenolicus TaxID=1306991 RepID=UPI001421F460|nr:Lar family restriction alleviation protein [Pseudomaricurvus alkylphenolicus]NIB41913.1 hypothetical protein [Pseudomaricurvus alkylphenolicus]
MATLIEPCPFCDSGNLHIHHHLLSHSVSCQSCKSTGPHRRELEDALLEWNHTSRLLRRARVNEESHPVHGRLHELEDAVRNLASALRYDGITANGEMELEHS